MAVKIAGCTWLCFVFLRILWTWWPQTGYIHPDEFFQAPEVIAGDIFNIVSFKPWEFNETSPVRSVVFPYLLTGLPFVILRVGASYHIANVNTENLVLASRLAVCFSSFLIDFVVWRICRLLAIDPAPALCVLSTSFVSLVFHTRPFSNTTESVLFALLLLLVVSDVCSSSGASNTGEHVRRAAIGAVVTSGFWNRPTFLVFALVPLVGWMYLVYSRKSEKALKAVVMSTVPNIFALLFGAAPTAAFFILCDSFYFGFLAKRQFVLTPLNFLKYNLDSHSLKDHGIHPRITHFVVNMPLLYGPLALVLFGFTLHALVKQDLKKCFELFAPGVNGNESKRIRKKNDEHTRYGWRVSYIMLIGSIIVPVCLLSIMPHQEPRFIIPVLAPLSVLFAHWICGPFAFRILTVLWVFWNIVGCTTFGILHQGGLYPCIKHLQTYLATNARMTATPTSYNLIFFHTYMPPQHLLAWPRCQNLGDNSCRRHVLVVHDMSGTSTGALLTRTESVLKKLKERKTQTGQNYVVSFPLKLLG